MLQPVRLITEFENIGDVTLQTGTGNDQVSIKAAPDGTVQNLRVNTSGGNDRIVIGALSPNTIINLGGTANSGTTPIRTSRSCSRSTWRRTRQRR